MPTDTRALAQATQRVKAMRKSGLPDAKIAAMAGVTAIAIRTIIKKGAGKTRGKNKRRLLAWIAKSENGATPSAQPASPPSVPAVTHVIVDLGGGRTVRLTTGQHYLLRNGQLLRRL